MTTEKYVFLSFKDMSENDVRRYLHESTACDALHLARSPYCPDFAFPLLCEYPDTEVRAALARRRGREAGQISRSLMSDKEQDVVEGVASNPSADKMILAALTRSKNSTIAGLAAQNQGTPTHAVDDYYVRLWSVNKK